MSQAEVNVLVVSRDPGLVRRLEGILPGGKARMVREAGIDQALERFEEKTFNVLIVTGAAFQAGETDGVELVEVVSAKSPATQVLFLLEQKYMNMIGRALKAGAYQYVRLPAADEELRLLVESGIEESLKYGSRLAASSAHKDIRFEQMVGRSRLMQDVYRQIRQASATDIPVLLEGETGTGKDLAARAIHRQSDRSEGPFVPVNLGALPSELVASELFGYEKGAFTGAAERREGKFRLASDGTIFLDEIATIDEKVQVSLLRLIEQKRFHRLGGRKAVKSNARIVAATNQSLRRAVERGEFREDLFFRLDVFRITMPPLRERTGDVPLLIGEFIKRYNREFGKEVAGVVPDIVSVLEAYDWPGNVRELKNVVQRAVLVCAGDVILAEHLPSRFRPGRAARPRLTFEVGTTLEEVEKEMIQRTLEAVGNNRKRAAEMLGISRRSLYNKLRKYSLE